MAKRFANNETNHFLNTFSKTLHSRSRCSTTEFLDRTFFCVIPKDRSLLRKKF